MTQCVTLVTGASSGIGSELARVFAARGHHVALVARRADRLTALADSIVADGGIRPLVLACDLTHADAADIIAAALAHAGVEVDTLVNNAGFGLFGEAIELDHTRQLDMITVNIRALTDLTLRFADSLIRHRGGLLNVASVAAFLPGPGMAVYYASKAYVLSFTDAMHNELGRRGVRVTALCPGPVPTEFQARAGFHAGMDSALLSVSPAAVALAGYRGLMRGRRVVLPGAGIRAIPFMLRFVPRGLVLSMVGLIQRRR
ncbi:MAG TPA: SDR family oxidoreductase [Xanthobacteraceae bacterium]|nr:SDR family oxidoreductase [Xanthobacteraceae bacterium]